MTEIVGQDKPTLEDALAHYGVKGMKWGQRKARNRANTARVASGGSSKADKARYLLGPHATSNALVRGKGNLQRSAQASMKSIEKSDKFKAAGKAKVKDILSLKYSKASGKEIKAAQRASKAHSKALNAQRKKINLTTTPAAKKAEQARLKQMDQDFKNSSDYALAMRSTRGQKAAITALSMVVAGPALGSAAAASTFAGLGVASRKVAYNQQKRKG
jgi:hypothetical protein